MKQESPPVGNRTRHTARSVTCSGGGYPVLARGYPSPEWGGGGTSVLARGIPQSWWRGVPQYWLGEGGYFSPGGGYPCPEKDLRPETWKRTWDWGTPRKDLEPETRQRTWDCGIPRVWTDKQTENITFPHLSDAGGKYLIIGDIFFQESKWVLGWTPLQFRWFCLQLMSENLLFTFHNRPF